MNLKLRTTKVRAVFEYEGDGMKASFELRPEDSAEELVGKLEKMLAFLRRELRPPLDPAVLLPALPPPGPRGHERSVPVGSASGVGTLMQQGLQQAKQFTGVPPVQPVPLQDSVARLPNGWELMGDDD